jgi:glyoxylase-like metal-dependent hydrolase (beta-lactamase superfamily II)
MNQLTFGDVTVTRVEEMHGPIMPPSAFFPTIDPDAWSQERGLLVPDHLNEAGDWVNVAMQTWVLHSGGKTILIDTGVGNDKSRPAVEVWDHNSIDFIGALASAGVAPADVDIVVNTHLHVDHVGWNTTLNDGVWVPTFRNATYLMPKADVEYWAPANTDTTGTVNENVYEDSVQPILDAGQVRTWDESYVIDDALTLQSTPGHTPGTSVVLLSSGDDHALFAGDLLHNPIQVHHHEHNSCFCLDPVAAIASRRRMFDWAIEVGATVLPAHFSGQGAFEISRAGSGYALRDWAALDRL